MPGDLDRPALVHPDGGIVAARQRPREPQAQLVHARPGRSQPACERHPVPQVIAVAVGHQQHVADLDRVGGLGALRVAEPRIEQDGLAAGRLDLDAGVAVPGERRIATETHRGHLRGGCYNRRYTRAVPATQIGQNLAFVNWTVLTGLALGSFAAVVMLRRRTSATPGYLRFTTLCAIGFGILAWISDGALPASLGSSPVVVDPAWDAPRRAALALFCILVAGGLVARRDRAARGDGARDRRALAAAVATLVFGALAWGDGSLGAVALLVQLVVVSAAIGGVFAAMILGHWYLVTPKLPEAPLILLARVLLLVVAVQVVLFWAWIATGAGPADAGAVRVAGRAVGAVRLAAPDRRAGLPAGHLLGVGPDRPDALDGIGDRAAVHQRRVDRGRDDPGRRPLFRCRTAGMRRP